MGYHFLEPKIRADVDTRLRRNVAKPEVHAAIALPVNTCRALAASIIAAHEEGLSWESRTRYAPGAAAQWDVNQKFRSSKNISPDLPGLAAAFQAMEAEAVKAFPALGLDPCRNEIKRIDDQCLIYVPGDHIGDHADDSASDTDDEGNTVWHVIKPQRHIVAVMWLTSQSPDGIGELEFAGGSLRFNSLLDDTTGRPLDIQPSAGLMVVFPATAWFRHEVLPVKAGIRLAVTRWWEVVPRGASLRKEGD